MIAFEDTSRFQMDDEGMYGIEQMLIKKHTWELGKGVVYGALVHDRAAGQQYFVTLGDLERYRQPLDVEL